MNKIISIILTERLARIIIEGIYWEYKDYITECESVEEKHILGLIKDIYPKLAEEFSSVYNGSNRYA